MKLEGFPKSTGEKELLERDALFSHPLLWLFMDTQRVLRGQRVTIKTMEFPQSVHVLQAQYHVHVHDEGSQEKTKPKDEPSDSEVTVPRRTHLRGRVRRGRNNSSAITNERGKLDSATFLHYFTHIWSAFPEETLKSVTYLDPLWFELYSNEKNRAMVLKWIKDKDVFSKKYVFVPIVMWSHWSILIFCHFGETLQHSKTNGPCMLLLDSLHAIGPTRLEPLIRRFVFDIYKSDERLESKEQLKKMPLLIPKVPQQKKGEECGFYILYFIKLFLDSAPENLNVSEGYPHFMKKDWFTVEEVESFCKCLDALPLVLSDDGGSGPADFS